MKNCAGHGRYQAWIAAGVVAAIGTAAYTAVGAFVYEYFFSSRAPKHLKALLGWKGEAQEPLEKTADEATRFYREHRQALVLKTEDKRSLHADIFTPDTPSDIWVICIHGYVAPAETGAGLVRQFLSWGYNVLCPHLRGHGDSEDAGITLGWKDRLDIVQWISHISRQAPGARVILFGCSMGAATVLMTTGEPLPGNVVCAVEDSGFTSVWEVAYSAARRLLHLPRPAAWAGMRAFRSAVKLRAGFDIVKASSLEQVRRSKTPTLFLHGGQDSIVPHEMLDALYEAANCEKERHLFAGMEHTESATKIPEIYWSVVKEFIDRYLSDNTPKK